MTKEGVREHDLPAAGVEPVGFPERDAGGNGAWAAGERTSRGVLGKEHVDEGKGQTRKDPVGPHPYKYPFVRCVAWVDTGC